MGTNQSDFQAGNRENHLFSVHHWGTLVYLAIGNWLVSPSCPLLHPRLRVLGFPSHTQISIIRPIQVWALKPTKVTGWYLAPPSPLRPPILHPPSCDSSVSSLGDSVSKLSVTTPYRMLLTGPLPRGTSMLGKLRPGKGNYREVGLEQEALPSMARVNACIPSALWISEPIYPLIPS